MVEREFVERLRKMVSRIIPEGLEVETGAALLYRAEVDNNLNVTVEPRNPKRGQSAFETDLAVFERKADDIRIPRVVFECKVRLTTHDILTYSTKARKHKDVYPYLRYGLIIAEAPTIPRRFFTHNEALDFCLAAGSVSQRNFRTVIKDLLNSEIKSSKNLERVAFGKLDANVFRSPVILTRRTRPRRRT